MELFYKVLDIAEKEQGENAQTIKDLISLTKNMLKKDCVLGLEYGKATKDFLNELLHRKDNPNIKLHYELYWQVLVAETPYSLDSYFQALEWNRPIKERFYLPRRKQLLDLVKVLEDLVIWDKYDEVFISMPARVGKSTLILFLLSWQIGMNSELANLYCSCSATLTSAFYKGLTEILNDSHTYLWDLIFPNTKWSPQSFANSKECYLDCGRVKRYHSFTGRSIDAESLNGAVDCNGLLIADDLCSGIEEALNKERLKMLNMKVNNNMLSRAKMGAKILWIGTRWSIADPIGTRINTIENTSIRYKVINKPALDDNDESNFDYLYGVGFSTEFYRNKRQSFEDMDDMPSFNSQYQQQPLERTGLLFEELQEYNGVLPSEPPDRKFAFCDIAWGGGDYTCMPIIYQYGKVLYCPEVVFDSSNKRITQPKIVNAIIKHDLGSVRFEKNNGGQEYKDAVEKMLEEKGYKLNITTRSADNTKSKEIKIFEHAPEIREIKFLESNKQPNDYKRAILQLKSFTISGKNKHDDFADALAGCIDMYNEVERKVKVQVFERFF